MANLSNIYNARKKNKGLTGVNAKPNSESMIKTKLSNTPRLQQGSVYVQNRASGGKGRLSNAQIPTPTNPVVSTTPKKPFFGGIPQAPRSVDIPNPDIVQRRTGQNSIFNPENQQAFGQVANQFDTFADARNAFESGTRIGDIKAEQASSRAFFNQLRDQGISQDELMQLTGANNALDARAIFEGRGGVDPITLARINEQYQALVGQKAIDKENERFKTEEEQIRADIEARYAPEFTKAKEAGQRTRETALRVQGRAAQGTKSGVQQQEINDRQQEIEQSIAAQQRLEERQQLAIARGASDMELESISNQISKAKESRVAAENELALREAGLDEAAIAKSEFNTEMMLKALKEGFEYDPETGSFTAQDGKQAIDEKISKMLGFASDEFGNPIIGENGEALQIEKDNDIEWGSYEDKYGNTVFYDKTNPNNKLNAGGTQVYTGVNGEPTSSPTSDSSGVQAIGQGDEYTRDDGTTGHLGENCVKFARENVPNLPFGLYNKQDKINAINSAVEQGFGYRGGTNAQVGDAILTSEGSVGHAAFVVGIDPQSGELILAEANYKPGQVTQGRRISMNDPSIYGTISSTEQPQMSSVINENATNEGMSPAVMDYLDIETNQDIPKYTARQNLEFKQWEASGFDPKELPAKYSSRAGEIKYENEYNKWKKTGGDIIKGKALGGTEARGLADAQTALSMIAPIRDIIDSGRTKPTLAIADIPFAGKYMEQTQKDKATLKRSMQLIGKYMEGGKLIGADEAKYENMLPNVTDLPAVARDKMNGIYDMLINKLETDITSYNASGYDTSGFDEILQNLQDEKANISNLASTSLSSQDRSDWDSL